MLKKENYNAIEIRNDGNLKGYSISVNVLGKLFEDVLLEVTGTEMIEDSNFRIYADFETSRIYCEILYRTLDVHVTDIICEELAHVREFYVLAEAILSKVFGNRHCAGYISEDKSVVEIY